MGETSLAALRQRLIDVKATEPGEFSIARLAKYEAGCEATIKHIERTQACVKRMIEAQTEEAFEAAIHEMAAHVHNYRPAYAMYAGELE